MRGGEEGEVGGTRERERDGGMKRKGGEERERLEERREKREKVETMGGGGERVKGMGGGEGDVGKDGSSRGKGVKVRWEGRRMAPLSQDLSLGLAHALSLRPPDRDLGYSFP